MSKAFLEQERALVLGFKLLNRYGAFSKLRKQASPSFLGFRKYVVNEPYKVHARVCYLRFYYSTSSAKSPVLQARPISLTLGSFQV